MNPNFRQPLYRRFEAEKQRVASVAAQDYTLRGRFLARGVGEFLIEIAFPVLFYRRPDLFPGVPVLETDTPQFEHFPTCEMGVAQWHTRFGTGDTSQEHYVGATIGVRVSGRSDQRVWIPYMFIGSALSSINVEPT